NPEFQTGILCFRNGGNLEEFEQNYQTRPEIPSLMDLDFERYKKLELPVDSFKPIMYKHARLPKKPEKPLFGPIRKANCKDMSTQVNFDDLIDYEYKLKTGDNFRKPRGIKMVTIIKKTLLSNPSEVLRNRATHKEIGVCTDPLFTPLINTPVIPEIRNHRERNYSSITIFSYIPNPSYKNQVEKSKVDTISLSEDSSDSSIMFLESEAKTYRDKSEYEKDYYEIFGTDSETESDDKLFIDEDKISSEEENEKLTNDEQMNGDKWINNEELELFAPNDDF
ncbi:unnamed protein product, partial [Brachionus calyciflorus]